MTQVPPTRLSSQMPTRAPYEPARRDAATPPEPAPIVNRSKSYLGMKSSTLRSKTPSPLAGEGWGEGWRATRRSPPHPPVAAQRAPPSPAGERDMTVGPTYYLSTPPMQRYFTS